MRICSLCRQDKPLSDFSLRKRKYKDGKVHHRYRCKECENRRALRRYHLKPLEEQRAKRAKFKKDNPNYAKTYSLREYGITLDDFKRMLADQGGKCYLCKRNIDGKEIKVDHNHKTGKVRKLLCHNCNTALGLLSDDPKLLRECVVYLEGHA